MSTSTNNGTVTKYNNPQPQQGKTVVIRTANGPVVRKVQPAPQPSLAATIVNWLKG